jgi:hypothetical protein
MPHAAPASQVEELFTVCAAASLPVEEAEISRTSQGLFCYFWHSPCEALHGLHVYIRDFEIVLSTNISHEHVEIWEFEAPDVRNEDALKSMVEMAVSKISAVLSGDLVFTRTYDAEGRQTSCGSGPREVVIEDLAEDERAWDWESEISVDRQT